MDLPTYTNIWKIEKRLYKLYDLRLPMPLPIVWIGVFVGVMAPWSLLLAFLGLPFDAPWHVLYLVPPGIVTWLSTRPVIESKRLTELLQSQVRYLGEPRTWCRMAPASEPSEITLVGRVWRAAPERPAQARGKVTRRARYGQTRRATAPSREVRPAVAAAAAAATAPVARERASWATASASRRGTAPALGRAVAVEAPQTAPQTAPLTTSQTPPPATRVVSAGTPGPTAPVAPLPSTGTPGRAVAAVPPETSRRPAPGAGTPARAASSASAGVPKAPAVPETPAASTDPDAPISTEALRRLRRLAASAEAERAVSFRAEPPVTPGAAAPSRPSDDPVPAVVKRPSGPGSTASAPPGERPAGVVASSDGDTRLPPRDASRKDTRREDVPAKAVPAENTSRTDVPKTRKGVPARETPREDAPVRGVPRESVPMRTDEDAWAQHRKGQPTPIKGRPVSDEEQSPSAAQPPAGPVQAARSRGDQDQAARSPGGPAAAGRTPAGQIPAKRTPAAQGPDRQRVRPPERQGGTPAGVSIRAVPSGPATPDPVAPAVPVPRPAQGETRVRRVESVVGRDSAGGWRRLAQVVIGPGGGGRTDGSEVDEARARASFSGSRRVVVLGCTGGAGQTTTALMLGHILARHREDRVLAVDANAGAHTLSTRVQAESPETLTSLLAGLDNVHGYLGMRAYTSRCASGLEVLAGDPDSGAEQRLSDRTLFSDRRLGQTMDILDRHYKLVVVDPAAALAARVLPYADQLVLVVPASEDAPDAVAMTYEWLDGHGCADLRRRAILVVNGVSRRSMGDVEQAEAVARGRCRAIVRVPWEDELAPGRSERVEPSHLRAPGRRAYLALAGVVVAGFGTAQAVRPSEEEVAQ